ncbi:DoxX family protein [Planctomonas sp. JC2975]|uniref:DoxX family protein n=1 Tax=Planctomonas sp. JC2975 TaxID=2729626 RepID=UPI0014754A0C|nr:DoxX family protein [Planctomonas sp. JC2975]NNC13712.1 DoxX family protein [Planctomonas sp. JC2975]
MGTLILRVVVGLLFIGHGLQKLAGLFGGGGLEQTEKTMDALGMHPARLQARAAGLAETAGGAALALGVATPFASAGLIATMITAIRKVHARNGIWNSNGGVEFNVVMIAAATLLAERPGKASVDGAFGRSKWGTGWAIFAIVAGALGSVLAIQAGKRFAPQTPADDEAAVEADSAVEETASTESSASSDADSDAG